MPAHYLSWPTLSLYPIRPGLKLKLYLPYVIMFYRCPLAIGPRAIEDSIWHF